MKFVKHFALGSAVLALASCSAYKGAAILKGGTATEKASTNDQETEPAPINSDSPSSDASADTKKETPIAMGNTPTDAQKDGKTFLALTDEEALHGLKEGEEQLKLVCDRNATKTNKVIKAFCVNKIRPKSLIELQAALGLAFPAAPQVGRGNNGAAGNGPAFAVQGHSSSLVGKFVSAINPRVILIDSSVQPAAGTANPNLVILGFVRGEQFAEVIAKNPEDNTLDFFLVGFKQACNAKPEGCSPGEMLTPAIESNWTSFTLYQDEELKNSIVDCRQCHQPDGPQSAKILRMQELRNPWTHWFRDNTGGGQPLIADYQAAHGTDEVYGGIPAAMISSSDPQKLENTLRGNGFLITENVVDAAANAPTRSQITNEFLTANIVSDLAATPGKSANWQALFDRFKKRADNQYTLDPATATATLSKKGTPKNYIPVPYRELKVTEPALLAKFTKQYQDFKAGTVTISQFADHREALRTDPQELADMGFAVGPSETAEDTLTLACSQCHQSSLDASISRSKFNAVDFSKMTNLNAEIDVAISRIKLGYTPERRKAEGIKIMLVDGSQTDMAKGEHLLTMPPRRFKQLTDTQIDALVKLLESKKLK